MAEPSKPALLLLHGALGSAATLQPLAEVLAADLAGECVVRTLDFAGHGGRAVVADTFTLPHFASEVVAFLRAEPAPAHVFGYSMGGFAALLAAAQVLDRFASLTALGTTLDWTPELVTAATDFLDPANILDKFPAFAEQLRLRHAPADWAAVVAATARLIRAAPLLTPAALATFVAPVHLLVGDADSAAGPAAMAAFAAQLPHGRFEVLPRTAHPLERVDLAMLAGRIADVVRSVAA